MSHMQLVAERPELKAQLYVPKQSLGERPNPAPAAPEPAEPTAEPTPPAPSLPASPPASETDNDEEVEDIEEVEVELGGTSCKVPLATEAIFKAEKAGRAGKKRKTIKC